MSEVYRKPPGKHERFDINALVADLDPSIRVEMAELLSTIDNVRYSVKADPKLAEILFANMELAKIKLEQSAVSSEIANRFQNVFDIVRQQIKTQTKNLK